MERKKREGRGQKTKGVEAGGMGEITDRKRNRSGQWDLENDRRGKRRGGGGEERE